MKKFTAVLWDVDGTLLNFDYSQRYALTKCFESAGREITEEMIVRYAQINDSYWRRLEQGEITKQELLTGRFHTLFTEYGIRGMDVEAFRREYQEALGSVYSYVDDSRSICERLQGQVGQYVVTNGVAATQENRLRLSGLYQLMDGIFISETIGAPKPQKAFFEYCLAVVGEKDKRRILIVGDSLSSDIRGGAAAGIVTCWYRPEDAVNETDLHPDYEISNLHQIFDILGISQ